VSPVLTMGAGPLVGVADECCVMPVLTTVGGLLVGVVEELCGAPILITGGALAVGVVDDVCVALVLTKGGAPLADVGPGVTSLPVRSEAFAGSALVPGLRAISPIRWGSSHGRLCRASPTRIQGELVARVAVQEP
jgi:hypothetical protein